MSPVGILLVVAVRARVHLHKSHRTLRDGSFRVALSQALRARLRSHRPSGTFGNRFAVSAKAQSGHPANTAATSSNRTYSPTGCPVRLALTSDRSPLGSPKAETTSLASEKSSPVVHQLVVTNTEMPAELPDKRPFRESSIATHFSGEISNFLLASR